MTRKSFYVSIVHDLICLSLTHIHGLFRKAPNRFITRIQSQAHRALQLLLLTLTELPWQNILAESTYREQKHTDKEINIKTNRTY